MNERMYHLIWFHKKSNVLNINWANNYKGAQAEKGDCYIRAIATDQVPEIQKDLKKAMAAYPETTDPMSLEIIRAFVAKNPKMLGEVRDCLGIVSDMDRKSCPELFNFSEPIQVRNIKG